MVGPGFHRYHTVTRPGHCGGGPCQERYVLKKILKKEETFTNLFVAYQNYEVKCPCMCIGDINRQQNMPLFYKQSTGAPLHIVYIDESIKTMRPFQLCKLCLV